MSEFETTNDGRKRRLNDNMQRDGKRKEKYKRIAIGIIMMISKRMKSRKDWNY